MSLRGKKTLAVAGLVVCATTISSVAGAEQRIQQNSDVRISIKQSNANQERQSNVDDQYAVQDSRSSSGGDQVDKPEEVSSAPRPEGENEEQADEVASGENTSESASENNSESVENEGEEKGFASAEETSSNASSEPQQNASPRSGQRPDPGPAASDPQDETPQQRSRPNALQSRVEPEVDEERTVQSPKIQRRVEQLEKQERAGGIRRAATGYSAERRPQELRIAREDIVAEPVDKAELRKYRELYEEAAEEYGFGEDWYILAAVGKVESDHGQNMGPSSAGALGPMQFMPSTWDAYGIDASGDGEANIMDPEDAIPSAAKYLKAGGAPDDWYEALFTYNHAGWYVEDVLEVAEGYRLAAGDSEAGPYYLEDR